MKLFILFTLLVTQLGFAQSNKEELKTTILKVAKSYEGQEDRDGSKEARLEALVQELESVIPKLSIQEKAQKIFGSWRQVYGPYSEKADGTIPKGFDTSSVYQIVSPEGFYYNVARVKFLGIDSIILLKGKYEILENGIKATFTKNSLYFKKVTNKNLPTLPLKLEAGEIKVVNLPKSLPPVGTSGMLKEVYADKDIRILRGESPTYTKGSAILIMEYVNP